MIYNFGSHRHIINFVNLSLYQSALHIIRLSPYAQRDIAAKVSALVRLYISICEVGNRNLTASVLHSATVSPTLRQNAPLPSTTRIMA